MKMLATKLDDLLIPEIHMVERDNRLLTSCPFPHTH